MDLEKKCQACGVIFKKDPRSSFKYWAKAKYCCSQCAGDAWSKKHKSTPAEVVGKMSDKYVVKENGCWEWQAATNGRYGVACINGKQRYAHRLALEAKLGRQIRKKMWACHSCNNPLCVNPDHIYEGTPLQNSEDAIKSGNIWWRKLKESDVREIRASSETHAALAEKYGVSDASISKIRKRQSWRHVP